MAFGAVEPLLATRGANGNLGIQDVFAMRGDTLVTLKMPGAWDTHHIVQKVEYLHQYAVKVAYKLKSTNVSGNLGTPGRYWATSPVRTRSQRSKSDENMETLSLATAG
jgi:hypothetical protein